VSKDWAAAGGYPALVLDPRAGSVGVQVFTSPNLPAHWARLDAFEGADYRRVPVAFAIGEARIKARIYVAAA
jgi:hypothetical protein